MFSAVSSSSYAVFIGRGAQEGVSSERVVSEGWLALLVGGLCAACFVCGRGGDALGGGDALYDLKISSPLPQKATTKVSPLCFISYNHEPPSALVASPSHTTHHTMALPTTTTALEDEAHWAVERATALPEVWALVAEHGDSFLGAWRLMRVCKAARVGAKDWLSRLPGLVVCGGLTSGELVSDAWRLDLATLRWEPMPALVTARHEHACCALRGTLVALGGYFSEGSRTSRAEMLSSSSSEEGGAFVDLPQLSCGGFSGAAAIAVEESDSAAGEVLLLGGADEDGITVSTVQLVDLATGACAQQPDLLRPRFCPAVGRLADGRVVCAGGIGGDQSAEVWGPPEQGEADAAWSWRELPAMSDMRHGCCGCVMSDGRFAVLGGSSHALSDVTMSSCKALVIDGDAHWAPLPPMHDARSHFACGSVAGCVIVAGGQGLKSAEVYDEERNRWLRLPCDLPYGSSLAWMGSAVL
jgi:hypothetical protein